MSEGEYKAVVTEPHIYALLLGITQLNTSYLWSGVAYTFEEAFDRARKQFVVDNQELLERGGQQVLSTPTLVLMNSHKLEDAIKDFEHKPEAKPVRNLIRRKAAEKRKPAEETKSGLMQRIINTRNRKMFDLYLDKFTKEEQKLIVDSCKWV